MKKAYRKTEFYGNQAVLRRLSNRHHCSKVRPLEDDGTARPVRVKSTAFGSYSCFVLFTCRVRILIHGALGKAFYRSAKALSFFNCSGSAFEERLGVQV